MKITEKGLKFDFDALMEQYNLNVSSFDRALQQKIFNVDNLLNEYDKAKDKGATDSEVKEMQEVFKKKDKEITSKIRIWLQMKGEEQAKLDEEKRIKDEEKEEAEILAAKQQEEEQAKVEEQEEAARKKAKEEENQGSVGFFNF